jgi:hypothetical protein
MSKACGQKLRHSSNHSSYSIQKISTQWVTYFRLDIPVHHVLHVQVIDCVAYLFENMSCVTLSHEGVAVVIVRMQSDAFDELCKHVRCGSKCTNVLKLDNVYLFRCQWK